MDALPGSAVLVDQVYDRLIAAITDWTLRPGQRVLQADLANTLGVSRQPVSHALQLLKQQGLVQETGRKGLEIAPIDPARIRQLYEVRGALDALAAGLVARRVRDDGLDGSGRSRLEEILDAGERLGTDAPRLDLVEADVGFHRALHDLSGNPAINEMVAPQWPHLRRSMHAVLEVTAFRRRAWTEHRDIARRVLAGDVEGAERTAHAHAVDAGVEIERRLRGSGPN